MKVKKGVLFLSLLCALAAFANDNLLGGKGKTARDIKRESAARRKTASIRHAIAKAKKENSVKRLDIKGLGGVRFWDKSSSNESVRQLEKPAFTRYTVAEIKTSPVHGICAITLKSSDPMLSSDKMVKEEVLRVARIFAEKFKFKFTSEIKESSNVQLGRGLGVSTEVDSVRGGIIGQRLEERTVVVKPATKNFYTIKEEFANCDLCIIGVKSLIGEASEFSISVSMKSTF